MVIIEMVRKGLGVAIIPYDLAAGASIRKVRVLPLEGEGFFREIGVLQRVTPTPSVVVSTLMECISRAAAAKEESSMQTLKADIAKGMRQESR